MPVRDYYAMEALTSRHLKGLKKVSITGAGQVVISGQ